MNVFLTVTALLAILARTGDPVPPVPTPGDPTEDTVLATYDLRGVLPRWDGGTEWRQSLGVVPAVDPRRENPSVFESNDYSELASYELLDLLTQILGDELRREGRELVVEGSVLTVLAPEALQEQVRSVLDAMQMALAGTIPVRVDILTLGEGSPGELLSSSTPSEEEATKLIGALLGRGAQHRSFQMELSAGRTARVDARRRIPFLFDYDVEIAQASMVFDPVMAHTFDGTQLLLRGLPVSGGLALSALILRSELLGKIEERTISVRGMVNHIEGQQAEMIEGPGTIQTPQVLVRGLSLDTLLPDGKALALSLDADLGTARAREIVILRRLGGGMTSYVARPIPRTNRTLIALNSELFRRGSLVANLIEDQDDHGFAIPGVEAQFDGEISSFLLEWLKVRFSIWRRFGPWILIVTDPAWDRDAAAELDKLVKSRREATRLLELGVDLRAQGRESSYPVRLKLPVLEGSSVGILVARGTTAVIDYDVEVAQGASVPDPLVETLFEGLAMRLSVDSGHCEAGGLAQLFDSPAASLETNYAMIGAIQLPQPRILRFDERLRLPEGQPGRTRIGVLSDRPDQVGMAVEVTVSAR